MKSILSTIINSVHNTSVKLRSSNLVLKFGVKVRGSAFEGKNKVYPYAQVKFSSIGFGSYIGDGAIFNHVYIGRYCSIAPNSQIIYGRHPIDYISTHPAFFSPSAQAGFTFSKQTHFEERRFADNSQQLSAIIGHDVWVGYAAMILEGTTIGTGAIIAAGSVVTKDVPAYAIVGGNPAKIIKYRFEPEIIESLLDSLWWEKPTEWIEKNLSNFQIPHNNISVFEKS